MSINIRPKRLLATLIAFSLSFCAYESAQAANLQQAQSSQAAANSAEPLKQTARDKNIAFSFTHMLEARHVSRKKIDATTSQRGFELYLKALDPNKIYFSRQDVDEFSAAYSNTLAELAKRGDLTPGYVIYNRLLQRIDERCAAAQALLEKNDFDFTVDEEFIRDKKLLTYATTEEESIDRMRKRLKFELLSFEADERTKEKEKEAKAANGEKVEDAPAPVSDRADDPVSKLKRRYSTFQKRMRQTSNDDVLDTYLTAIANAFDPHTTYMSPKTYENFMIQISLNLEGIGATLQWDDGYTIVKRIVKGSPAEKQGELKVDDKIVAVGQENGEMEDVVDMKLTDVVDKIRGKGGTTVRLEVVSTDGSRKVISIVREKVDLEDSAAQSAIYEVYQKQDGSLCVVDPKDEKAAEQRPNEYSSKIKVGVIDLPSFYLDMESKGTGRSCSADVHNILDQFNAENVDACVVDLRYNGGGSLPEAVLLTGLFIKTGAVVQTKPSELGDRPRSLNDPDPSIVWTKPLVVMTSRLSASASEIFSGAIKDYGRGVIVGDETTHGKGSVQSMTDVGQAIFGNLLRGAQKSNLGSLKVTIQGYYLPSGNSPQLQGVKSDVQLPQFTSVLEDVAESDLDYPLTFEKVDPANYPRFSNRDEAIVAQIAQKSKARVDASEEFQKEIEKMRLYKDSKLRKATPLNREKYFAELDKLNANKEETEKLEEIVNGDSGVVRDFYLDEILYLTKDYYDALQTRTAL